MPWCSRPSKLAPEPVAIQQCTPWTDPADPEVHFPLAAFEELLAAFGWADPQQWLHHWQGRGGVGLAQSHWSSGTRRDWIWGLGLPLLTQIEHCLGSGQRRLIGVSGLPGSGKTSLGRWLEAAAAQLGWPVAVISLDDFYFAAAELDRAMAGNPWGVPRALPGSHDLALMERVLSGWQRGEALHAPRFDKALRGGRGDRCGWHSRTAELLLIEGWFLGCSASGFAGGFSQDSRLPFLTAKERAYRPVVEAALKTYEPIWQRLDFLWHLKALEFNATATWKSEQEQTMLAQRGVSLPPTELNQFVRMILSALPQAYLEAIHSDAQVDLTMARQLNRITLAKSTCWLDQMN